MNPGSDAMENTKALQWANDQWRRAKGVRMRPKRSPAVHCSRWFGIFLFYSYHDRPEL
jgi:hypothetical protein